LAYGITLTEEAKDDFDHYPKNDRVAIIEKIKEQLLYLPLTETKNKKTLEDNPLAPWELRVGKFRVFYKVEEQTVTVVAIGHKERNKLILRGMEVELT